MASSRLPSLALTRENRQHDRSEGQQRGASRRDFMRNSSLAAGGVLATGLNFVPSVHAAGDDALKVGLIGCGGRGTGAVGEHLRGGRFVVQEDQDPRDGRRLRGQGQRLSRSAQGQREVPGQVRRQPTTGSSSASTPSRRSSTAATWSSWRPRRASVPSTSHTPSRSGKNVFCEKPVAVDGTGIRKVMEAAEKAKSKGLAVVTGTQRRHQAPYIEA